MSNGNGVGIQAPALPQLPMFNPQAMQQMAAAPFSLLEEQTKVFGNNIQGMFNNLNSSSQSLLAALQAPFTQRSPSGFQEALAAPIKAAKAAAGIPTDTRQMYGMSPAPVQVASPAITGTNVSHVPGYGTEGKYVTTRRTIQF